MRLRKVTIHWDYPKKLDNMWYDDRIGDFGLYYISRKIYVTPQPKETLLYIGQTNNTFWERLNAHYYDWMPNHKGEKFVRLGRITRPEIKDNKELKLLIKDVESALIYDSQPKQNRKCKNRYGYYNYCTIINKGKRGNLNQVISMKDHQDSNNLIYSLK